MATKKAGTYSFAKKAQAYKGTYTFSKVTPAPGTSTQKRSSPFNISGGIASRGSRRIG